METAKAVARDKSDAATPNQSGKLDARVAGTYQLTQASRVYAQPSEFSQSIGEIDPGTKVNVVSSRDGWLEIHSKYGRPPGFIRKEVALRLAEQN